MHTQWHKIPKYKKYVISKYGKVKDRRTWETVLVQRYRSNFFDIHNTYLAVSLVNNKGTKDILLLHELVASVFLPIAKPWQDLVIHKNGKICDNRASNLTRCTRDSYPNIITQIQLNERYTIYKYLNNWRLFDTFNSFTEAAASTKTTRPLTRAAIREACFRNTSTIAGVWYWRIEYHSRIPVQPRYSISVMSDHSFAKPIHNYLNFPVITPAGFIYNYLTGNPIYPHFTATHYLAVYLQDYNGNNVLHFVHHLVMNAFKNTPDDYSNLQIDHIDGNKANPHIDNLEWVTRSENSRRWREMYAHFSMTPKADVFIETGPSILRSKSSILRSKSSILRSKSSTSRKSSTCKTTTRKPSSPRKSSTCKTTTRIYIETEPLR
jgi:hypothetical protein